MLINSLCLSMVIRHEADHIFKKISIFDLVAMETRMVTMEENAVFYDSTKMAYQIT